MVRMRDIRLKRVSKNELIELYNNSRYTQECRKFRGIKYYCKKPIVILNKSYGLQVSNLWFINENNELIYDINENIYINLNLYDKKESLTKDIFVGEWIFNENN